METATKKAVTKHAPKLRFDAFGEGWKVTLLGELLTFKNGVNAEKGQYGSGYKFINVLDILQNDFITHDVILGSVEITEKEFEKNEVIYGDILFQRSSETREDVGRANVYLDKEHAAVFGGFVIRGRAKKEYHPEFMNYMLRTAKARQEITTKSGGSTRYNVGQEVLEGVSVLIPTLPEQQKIAGFLSAVDARIQQLTRKKALLEQYKKGVMQQLFSQEIRFTRADGSDMHRTAFAEWEEKRLGEVCKFQVGSPFSSSFFNTEGRGHRLVKNRDLKSDDQPFFFDGPFDNSYLVADGDILIGMDGDFLLCRWQKGTALLNQRVGRILITGMADKSFLYYFVQGPLSAIENITAHTTVKHLSHSDVENIKQPLPSLEEQQKIAGFLGALDARVQAVGVQLAGCQNWKKGLLQQLFV